MVPPWAYNPYALMLWMTVFRMSNTGAIRTRGVYLQANGAVLQHRIIHRAFHAAVQPNATPLRGDLFNAVFGLELNINFNPPPKASS